MTDPRTTRAPGCRVRHGPHRRCRSARLEHRPRPEARGIDVVLDDASPASCSLAVDYGAGRAPKTVTSPALVVVAVPPDVTADVIERRAAALPMPS